MINLENFQRIPQEKIKKIGNDDSGTIEVTLLKTEIFANNEEVRKELEDVFRVAPCNLTTCRYNQTRQCINKDQRKECIDVDMKVLFLEKR